MLSRLVDAVNAPSCVVDRAGMCWLATGRLPICWDATLPRRLAGRWRATCPPETAACLLSGLIA